MTWRLYDRMKTPLIIFAIVGATAGFLAQCSAVFAEPVDGRRINIIDGDTVALPGGERIRLRGIDTPETHRPSCEAELVAGLKAKEWLARILRAQNGQPIALERCDVHGGECQDKYGRTLANLVTPQGDVGDILIGLGFALPYRPGERAARTAWWCRR